MHPTGGSDVQLEKPAAEATMPYRRPDRQYHGPGHHVQATACPARDGMSGAV